jgi:hypothetical protein
MSSIYIAYVHALNSLGDINTRWTNSYSYNICLLGQGHSLLFWTRLTASLRIWRRLSELRNGECRSLMSWRFSSMLCKRNPTASCCHASNTRMISVVGDFIAWQVNYLVENKHDEYDERNVYRISGHASQIRYKSEKTSITMIHEDIVSHYTSS